MSIPPWVPISTMEERNGNQNPSRSERYGLSPSETGDVDEQTGLSLAAFQRWRAQGTAAHSGRVVGA